MANKEFFDNRLEHIARLLDTTVLNLNKIKDMVVKLDFDAKRDLYRNVEGVSGVFDGTHMVGEDGQKYEIPANYSAKTRIVYGDVLKMIEEDGKHVYKQITKVPRKKVEGVLTKKEGKWHIISDSGTFRVSDVAAEFYKAELNDEAAAFIPEDNLKAPFAALDRVKKGDEPAEATSTEHVHVKPATKTEHKAPEVKTEASVASKVALAKPVETDIAPAAKPVASRVTPQAAPRTTQPAAPRATQPAASTVSPVATPAAPKPANTQSRTARDDSRPRNDSGRDRNRGRDDGRGRSTDSRSRNTASRGRSDSTGDRPAFRDGPSRSQSQGQFSRPPRAKKDFSDAPDDAREATTTITSLDDDDLR